MPDNEGPAKRSYGFEEAEEDIPRPQGKYYLFVIAVNDYSDGFDPLKNPVRDANSIVNILLERYCFEKPAEIPDPVFINNTEIIPYDTNEVKCLYNEKATPAAIYKHLNFLAGENGLKENDSLLIYFAGHGANLNDDEEGHIMPYGARSGSEETYLKCQELFTKFNKYTTKKKCRDLLLVLDCCTAGGVAGGLKVSDPVNDFSRYGLTSATMDQEALDGEAGSPFSNALYKVLKRNTAPYLLINEKELQEEFNKQMELWANQVGKGRIQHKQTIQYRPLTECGTGEFRFQLNDPDIPPVDQLSSTFIRHLNFSDQKTDIATDFFSGGEEELIIITSVCKNSNIHKLYGKVLLEELKELGHSFVFSAHYAVEPEQTMNDTWRALAKNFEIPAQDNIQQQCVSYICDRLIMYNNVKQPLIIYLGYNFQSANLSNKITQFCKEFKEELARVKSGVAYDKDTKFNSLFLIIGETRSGDKQFFFRDDFVTCIGAGPKIIVSRPVCDLSKGLAVGWHQKAKGYLKSRNIQELQIGEYFERQARNCCDLDIFIMEISKDVGVNEKELAKQLWSF